MDCRGTRNARVVRRQAENGSGYESDRKLIRL